uniref:GLOBIN domain-containing protein n=1 Tax=Bursaphelenchus xylophilus TaxID=6326 RepID=A0A1I7SPJ7_BURXY
ALEITINFYTIEHGFVHLPSILQEFVSTCLVINVCPTLVRKAFMEGLIGMLIQVLGEPQLSESSAHTWSKVYRVLEQNL